MKCLSNADIVFFFFFLFFLITFLESLFLSTFLFLSYFFHPITPILSVPSDLNGVKSNTPKASATYHETAATYLANYHEEAAAKGE